MCKAIARSLIPTDWFFVFILTIGFFLLPLQFGNSVQADHWGNLDTIQPGDKVMVRAGCKGEEAMTTMFEALQRDVAPPDKVIELLRSGVCRKAPMGLIVKVFRVVSRAHDWQGDPFVIIELLAKDINSATGIFAPIWGNQLMPES